MKNWLIGCVEDFKNILSLLSMKWSKATLLHLMFFTLTWAELYSFARNLDATLTQASLSGISSDFLPDADNPVAVYAAELNSRIDAEASTTPPSISRSDIALYSSVGLLLLSSFGLCLLILLAIEATNKRRLTLSFSNARARFSLLDRRFGLGVILLVASLKFTLHYEAVNALNVAPQTKKIEQVSK